MSTLPKVGAFVRVPEMSWRTNIGQKIHMPAGVYRVSRSASYPPGAVLVFEKCFNREPGADPVRYVWHSYTYREDESVGNHLYLSMMAILDPKQCDPADQKTIALMKNQLEIRDAECRQAVRDQMREGKRA